MKEEKKNSAGLWASALVGLLLLYILSPGPVWFLCKKIEGVHFFPDWFLMVYDPIFELCDHSRMAFDFYMFCLNMS